MEQIDKIIFDRIVLKKKDIKYFMIKYSIDENEFKDCFKSLEKINKKYADNLIVKCMKLFKSKVKADQDIYIWNKKNKSKGVDKSYCFSHYSKINEQGKSIKSSENFELFYNDIKHQYDSQTKLKMQYKLEWIRNIDLIQSNDHVCYYCGISEGILNVLYNGPKNICKTKRNRGSWFELDRMNTDDVQNVYKVDNIVLSCYFCNNHKSDVISADDMIFYFGKSMFQFLLNKYNSINL
jgi:hypothetical protein